MATTASVSGATLPSGSTVVKDSAGRTVISVSGVTSSQLQAAAVKAKDEDGKKGKTGKIIDGLLGDILSYTPLAGLNAAPLAVDSIKDGVGATKGIAKGTAAVGGSIIKLLGDSVFWLRVGMGALGTFVLIVGLVFMLESTKTGRALTAAAIPL